MIGIASEFFAKGLNKLTHLSRGEFGCSHGNRLSELDPRRAYLGFYLKDPSTIGRMGTITELGPENFNPRMEHTESKPIKKLILIRLSKAE